MEKDNGMSDGIYHATRLAPDPRRDVLWQSLWRYYFSKWITPDDCVVELGCGYGNFINAVVAKRRIALDTWPAFPRYLSPGVEAVLGPATELGFLDDHSVDFVFASNLFEHLPHAEFRMVLDGLRNKFSPRGMLTILQPNYRYAYREYFDDYTHITVYSHISISDFLAAHNYEVLEIQPRFLPLTIKSRLPVSPWLIRAYLLSPLKWQGKQMLIRARPKASSCGETEHAVR
jgi:SAM-dependent methyltransferase